MQLKMFVVPIKNLGGTEAETNGFLRGHRVLAVRKHSCRTTNNAPNCHACGMAVDYLVSFFSIQLADTITA